MEQAPVIMHLLPFMLADQDWRHMSVYALMAEISVHMVFVKALLSHGQLQ